MIWIIGFVLLGIIGLCALIYAATGPENERAGVGAVAIGVIVLQVMWFAIFSIHVVDSRSIGVIKTFSRITGQTSCDEQQGIQKCGGLTITAPWQSIEIWDVREIAVQLNESEKCGNGDQRCTEAGDNQSQPVYVRPTLRIKVNSDNVQRLAVEYDPDNYEDKIIRPLVRTIIKNTTSKYEATAIHRNRSMVEAEVKEALARELTPYSIGVVRMTFDNLDFSASYNKSIDLKAAQTQKALEEENKVLVIQQQAKQAEEAAKGRAAALIAEAAGQAEANRLITGSITPNLIQWQAVQKLGDKIQIALLPSGQGIIIDPATLLKQNP